MIQGQYKQKYRYIPPYERRNLEDSEAKHIDKLHSTTLLKVTKKDEVLQDLKGDIEGIKLVILSHSKVIQVFENIIGQESMMLHQQRSRETHTGGVVNTKTGTKAIFGKKLKTLSEFLVSSLAFGYCRFMSGGILKEMHQRTQILLVKR